MLNVQPIQAFQDNYIWLITRPGQPDAYIVDPGDAAPVLATLEAQQLNLKGILITHHHHDHVGGIKTLLQHYNAEVIGTGLEDIPYLTQPLREGDEIEVLDTTFRTLEVPGHTRGHIALFSDNHGAPLLFCGDTLFAGGCGRLFEGTAQQMQQSLAKLRQLPPATQIYCAHEYTLANLQFAAAVEPDNQRLQARIEHCQALRHEQQPTLPSRLADELATNPFLRWDQPTVIQAAAARSGQAVTEPADVFAAIRAWKDTF